MQRLRDGALASLLLALFACSDTPKQTPPTGCNLELPAAGGDGHADPTGARTAKQARAGRIKDLSWVRQPDDARQRIAVGDFLLTNEKIAVAIEDKGPSDGYARFGGEILALDRVGEDGKMIGASRYGETLLGFAGEMIDPEAVGVVKDGSDGGEAVVRVAGRLKLVPFLETFKGLFKGGVGFRAAIDFALAPGAEELSIRATLLNDTDEDKEILGLAGTMFGMFHSSRAKLFTPVNGFGPPVEAPFVAYVPPGDTAFAFRVPQGNVRFAIEASGFQYFYGHDVSAPACKSTAVEIARVVVGGPGLDGVRQAILRADGAAPWREVKGTVVDGQGNAAAGAVVEVVDEKGLLLTNAVADANGAYVVHVPPQPVSFVPVLRGHPSTTRAVAPGETSVDLALGPTGTIVVHAKEKGTNTKLPVRVQVIPDTPPPPTPDVFGLPDEVNGRLHQAFAVSGDARLPVPPGTHRVIVSRGYEWELVDVQVTVGAGEEKVVDAELVHSVDSSGVMCADFHIHSFYSADSSDPVAYKVKGAVADGLDIPVSSEHEWVVDFDPVVQELGLGAWAFGMPSEELTTFAWGHFGVVPLKPKADKVNRGGIEWIGKQPPEMFADVAAQAEKPVLIVNHPRAGGGFGAIGAYFDAARYDRTTDKGDSPLWSDQFQAIECFNDSDFEANRAGVVKDWFAMLRAGRRRVAVGSSDSHHLRTSPVGYPRTCMTFGHDDPRKLTPETVRDVLASGAAVVSGGLFMSVRGPGGEGPGQIVPGSGSVTFTVTVQSPGWVDASELEVIVDGETQLVEPLEPVATTVGHRWENVVTLERGTQRRFVVFHAKGKGDLTPLHPGRRAFAVSNPVWY
jgi:hypothetical protein